MTRRARAVNAIERTALTFMMAFVALVMEQALERMVEKRPGEAPSRSGFGRRFLGRVIPALQIRHRHERQGPPEA